MANQERYCVPRMTVSKEDTQEVMRVKMDGLAASVNRVLRTPRLQGTVKT